ncbi:MAG: hypothetical protein JWM68_4125 [Verrucomicrobiales bacterium]|nr:hypothetical protein [Verrucomicrobiales bacterium]
MENPIERTIPALLTSAGDVANAARRMKDELLLLQNPEAKIRDDIESLASSRDSHETAKTTLRLTQATVRELFETALESLTLARDIFKPRLGKQFGAPWSQLGMPDSLYFPRSAVALQPIVDSYATFLETNPSAEVPSLNITATYFATLFADLAAARSAVKSQELQVALTMQLRDEKAQQLRKRIRGVIDELHMLMEPLDPRWKTFGFNQPGAEQRPDAPENIQVVLVNETTAMIEIPSTPRASYYRVYKRVIGVDAEPVAIGSPSDTDFTQEDLPRKATVEFFVSAVNSGGESALSAPVTVVTQ